MPKDIQLEVIPEPKEGTASVLSSSEGLQVLVKGQGDTTYICGGCRKPICENVRRGQIGNLVFRCSNCGCFNLIRGT